MKFNFGLITFSFFLVLFSVSIKAQTKTETPPDVLNGGKITGAWRINFNESDNPLLKMQAALRKKLTPDPGGKTVQDETLPTMSISLVAPENLLLTGDENSITINEGFNEIIFTRLVATDGKPRCGEFQEGGKFSVTAERNEYLMKIVTVSPRGNKMLETYALSGDGKKLTVTVRVETPEAKEMLALRRVYDRVMPDVFSTGTEDVQ